MLHALDSPSGSPINCISSYDNKLVFGGCQDGSIIAWDVLANKSDSMKPPNMNVSYCSALIKYRT